MRRRSSSWESPRSGRAQSLSSMMISRPSRVTRISRAQRSRPPNCSATESIQARYLSVMGVCSSMAEPMLVFQLPEIDLRLFITMRFKFLWFLNVGTHLWTNPTCVMIGSYIILQVQSCEWNSIVMLLVDKSKLNWQPEERNVWNDKSFHNSIFNIQWGNGSVSSRNAIHHRLIWLIRWYFHDSVHKEYDLFVDIHYSWNREWPKTKWKKRIHSLWRDPVRRRWMGRVDPAPASGQNNPNSNDNTNNSKQLDLFFVDIIHSFIVSFRFLFINDFQIFGKTN